MSSDNDTQNSAADAWTRGLRNHDARLDDLADRVGRLESGNVLEAESDGVDPFKVRPTTHELDPDPTLAQSNRLYVEQLDEIQRMANAAIAKYYNLAASHMHANQSPVRGVETVVKLLGQESSVCGKRRDRIRELEAENITAVDDLQRMGKAFQEETAELEAERDLREKHLDDIQSKANRAIVEYWNKSDGPVPSLGASDAVDILIRLLKDEFTLARDMTEHVRSVDAENRQLRARIKEIHPSDPAQTANIMDQAVAEILLANAGCRPGPTRAKRVSQGPGLKMAWLGQ